MKRGGQTRFRPEFCAIGQALAGQERCTRDDLAAVFEVSTKTVRHWLVTQQLFREAVLAGRCERDQLVVAAAKKRFADLVRRGSRSPRRVVARSPR
jgi:hypothetical protein